MPGTKTAGGNHFDVVFLGDSLAGRLSAALCAKKGCRVLTVHDNKDLPTPWLTSSLLLERLLDFLDGRSCSTTPFHFQVITQNQRIDINGKNPLKDELRRELIAEHAEVAVFLDDMESLGNQLEEVLWEHQGLPKPGIGNRFSFRKRCFRADIPRRVFRQTLRERISEFSEPGARKILTSLFSGFSFTPSNSLTLAECALIWSGLGRQSGVFKNGLEELLLHRYKQFHGEEKALHHLARIRGSKDGTSKILFDDDSVFTTDHLVFADREKIALCEGLSAPAQGRMTHSHLSANIKGRISPLLANNVILDGNPPLRINIEKSDSATKCRIENAMLGDRGLSSAEQIEKRTRKILPFIDLALQPVATGAGSELSLRSASHSSIVTAYEKIVFDHGRKFLCCGPSVIPELGTVGDILVAMTVTNKLLQATGNPPL